MRSNERLIKILREEAEVGITDNPKEAMYILSDGTLIDGQFYYGSRTQDHRVIFIACKYDPIRDDEAWKKLHRDYRLVRLVPECEIAMIKGRQRLTEAQERIIKRLGYEIERY